MVSQNAEVGIRRDQDSSDNCYLKTPQRHLGGIAEVANVGRVLKICAWGLGERNEKRRTSCLSSSLFSFPSSSSSSSSSSFSNHHHPWIPWSVHHRPRPPPPFHLVIVFRFWETTNLLPMAEKGGSHAKGGKGAGLVLVHGNKKKKEIL